MKRLLCALALSCTAHAAPPAPPAAPAQTPAPTSTPTPTSTPAATVSPDGQKLGSLDPAIIRKVVRDHAGQIRWCYETALTKTPGIRGKLIVKWVIDGMGDVVSTGVVQALHPAVDGCVAARIAEWKFPKPTGGGIVVVNYPFVFRKLPSSSIALESSAAETVGSLSADVVKKVVVDHGEQVTNCLTTSKRDDIAGTLQMKWVIDKSGAVARVSTVDSIGHPEFETCLSGVIAKWTFPEPTDGGTVTVTYPFGITKVPSPSPPSPSPPSPSPLPSSPTLPSTTK